MRVPRKVVRLLALAAVSLTAGFALAAITASPASANDDNHYSVDTSNTRVLPSQNDGGTCQQGKDCKRTNWCDKSGGAQGALTDDAPLTMSDGKSGNHSSPPCTRKPKIDVSCCVIDKTTGKTYVEVVVANPNERDLYVKIVFSRLAPQYRLVGGGKSVAIRYDNIVDGEYALRASVAISQAAWCSFTDTFIKVHCHKASPSPSPSKSSGGAVVPSPSVPSLPVTGSSVVPTAVKIGGGSVVAGGVLLFGWWRLRRDRNVVFVAR